MSVYISEVDYDGGAGSNFVEVVAPGATDMSGYSFIIYNKNGEIVESFSFGPPVNTVAGKNVYLFDDNDPNFPDVKNSDALALVDDQGNVIQFIAFKDPVTAAEGPANGQSATQVGQHSRSNKSLQSNDGGNSYSGTPSSDPGTVPCYAPGTLIETLDGPRAVETLKPGDLVMTLDHGPQPVRWTHRGEHPLEDAEVDAKPVQIKAGALGHNLPTHDLIVSPQHRIFVGGAGQLHKVFASEAFAPAKSLTAVPGIRHMKGKTKKTWVHFACDRHEVVTANGCLSESLLLGPMVMNGLSPAERRALTDMFGPAPTPDTALNGPPARNRLTVGAVKRQIAKHLKEKGQLVAKESQKWDRDLAIEKYEAERMREALKMARAS